MLACGSRRVSADAELVAFWVVHDHEVDRVLRVVVPGRCSRWHPARSVRQPSPRRSRSAAPWAACCRGQWGRGRDGAGSSRSSPPEPAETRSADAGRPGRRAGRRRPRPPPAERGRARARSSLDPSAAPADSPTLAPRIARGQQGHLRLWSTARTSCLNARLGHWHELVPASSCACAVDDVRGREKVSARSHA